MGLWRHLEKQALLSYDGCWKKKQRNKLYV